MRIETSDIATQKATSITSYAASFGAAAGGVFSLNEWAILLGIVFAALTFLANCWFQHKRNEREAKKYEDDKEFHRARMQALQQSDQAHLICGDNNNGY
ncbi:HP1 family phage holin [Pseudoalteromonas sp. Z9A6]|uniref:HP1 family phage holin n=1 Tax=Pseudoalteromonas sp. Z9A6 TaxID=2686352 RepID=UPI0013FD1C5C|nr:HP1 family phage holin [Pseudoalteromonas sp. Z9A6]